MNRNRIIISGLVAGVFILGMNMMQLEYAAANVANMPAENNPLSFHVVRSFALGLVSMLLYAIIAKARGHGNETAITTGLLVFMIGVLFPPYTLGSNGSVPDQALLIYIVWSAVWIPMATFAGAQFYREQSDAVSSTA